MTNWKLEMRKMEETHTHEEKKIITKTSTNKQSHKKKSYPERKWQTTLYFDEGIIAVG